MRRVLWGLVIVAVGFWSYNIGTLYPRTMPAPADETSRYRQLDQGCDSVRLNGDRLMCEVEMNQPVYVIKTGDIND